MKCAFDKMVSNQDKFYRQQCVHDQEQSLNDSSSSNACNIVFGKLSDFLNTKGLAMFHQNINGLLGKLDNLRSMLHETKRKIDILGPTETHLHHDIFDEEIAINGYTFIHKDRKSGPGGG